jgi:radical SAM protein with 4Fe4S-binding SPASM domain
MRVTLSTNGTLIAERQARECRDAGVSYVGISMDGLERTNDRFRGQDGAFNAALAGIRACRAAGVKVGLRFTMAKHNLAELGAVFDLLVAEDIPRCCFYHFVDAGRGEAITAARPSHADMRAAIDLIIDRTADLHARGLRKEILTVDNHADGPFLYLRMQAEGHPDAETTRELLRLHGGNSTGLGIGCVSWDGTVYPDQFWRTHPLGNVRKRRFSEIWTDPGCGLLAALRERRNHVEGRCPDCRFLDICGGNLRARGEAATGRVWGYDPACYLTDEETACA